MRNALFRGLLLLAAVFTLILAGLGSASAEPDEPDLPEDKPTVRASLFMINQRSDRCVEVPGFSGQQGAHVDQYSCRFAPDQTNEMWSFRYIKTEKNRPLYQIINTHSGKCMNVQGASKANGAAVLQWTCSRKAANNLWYIDEVSGYHVWRNHNSEKCLNVAGASKKNGAWLVQYTCGNYDNEHFKYTSLCHGSPTEGCVKWPWYGW